MSIPMHPALSVDGTAAEAHCMLMMHPSQPLDGSSAIMKASIDLAKVEVQIGIAQSFL
jgi:hypothetical protein